MKKFTVKDFLLYACPCFGCGKPASVRVGVTYDDQITHATMDGSIAPSVTQHYLRVDLKINYHNALTISIDYKTNKFATNDPRLLKKYLEDHAVYLISTCSSCNTRFESCDLPFNLEKGFVSPVEMRTEFFVIRADDNVFHCFSDFENKTTMVDTVRVDKTVPLSSTTLNLPLLPCYQFKDKARFIKKMKTYLLFS